MSNDELRISVEEELRWEPRIDSFAIAVNAQAGLVTLRGTVGSLREKFEAERAAKRVYGVKSVDDQLQLKILGENSRDDAELRGAVLQALELNSVVPASSLDATAVNGVVTLSGSVEYQFEREEADSVASKVPGVTSIDDQIELLPPGPSANDVHHSIEKALERMASSTPTTSRSRASAPGVTTVDDKILIDD